MELLSKYQSSGSGSSEGEDQSARLSANEIEVQQQISRRANRQVYLLTLRQVPTLLVPTRQDFADAVISAYQSVNAEVMHWCVSKESHEHRGKGSEYHYYIALKCDRPDRWLPIATHLRESRVLRVHFSSNHTNYYSAYSYVVKEDCAPLHSPSHPDLSNQQPPRTTIASEARIRNNQLPTDSSKRHTQDSSDEDTGLTETVKHPKLAASKKGKKLQPSDLFDIVVPRYIRTKQELLVFAKAQKDEGKTDLWEFCFNLKHILGKTCV